jgi:prepilin-type N-terminal cleavage/methylation domain-containing protein
MYHFKNHSGFTLIEVIVTIIVSSILAVLLMQVMKGHSDRSWWPLMKTSEGLALREVIENISADYRSLLISDPTPLVTLQTRIDGGAAGPNGYWFDKPYSTAIQILENRCLDEINKDDDPSPGEIRFGGTGCSHPADTLLKVTLAYDTQSLTAVFSR